MHMQIHHARIHMRVHLLCPERVVLRGRVIFFSGVVKLWPLVVCGDRPEIREILNK